MARVENYFSLSFQTRSPEYGLFRRLSRTMGTQGDNATLIVQFKDHSGKALGTAQIGPVSIADRKNQTQLVQRSTTGNVPQGSVTLVVTLRMLRTFGTDNDGYADNLSLILRKS